MPLSRSVTALTLFTLLSLCACRKAEEGASAAPPPSLVELRRSFQTRLQDTPETREPAPAPPAGVFEKVTYTAPLGSNVAYVTPVREGPRRPAVLWIQGGFDWGIGESAWEEAPRDNDQSARAFREAGLVLMMPSLRGCNDNPGSREYFLGEVDDILAALEWLARRPDVDPERIYLGGHSTGGTLALLTAASGARVRGVFAFGPIDDVSHYGKTGTALDGASGRELWMRNPVSFMDRIRVPTLVIEGAKGNIPAFAALRRAARDAPVEFHSVPAGTHFNILAPMTELLARKIAHAGPEELRISLSEQETLQTMQAKATAD
jgi:dipeptidyl aminopeptidase/acylaminoacyl peptidase